MSYDLFEASKKLSRININLGLGMHELTGYWCRVVVPEREMYNPKSHKHSFFELHLCIQKSGTYSIGDTEITISKSEFILFPPSCEHRIISEPDGFRKLVWGFDVKDKRVEECLLSALSKIKAYRADEEVLNSVEIILNEAFYEKYGYFNIVKGQLSNIYARIVRAVVDISEENYFDKKPSLVISEIRKYILDNLADCPTVKDISSQFFKSQGTLDKMCMSEYGISISTLKKQLQFERIKELLSETTLSLDAISEMCGFADRYAMGKFFKKYEGTPPGEFRKWLKN